MAHILTAQWSGQCRPCSVELFMKRWNRGFPSEGAGTDYRRSLMGPARMKMSHSGDQRLCSPSSSALSRGWHCWEVALCPPKGEPRAFSRAGNRYIAESALRQAKTNGRPGHGQLERSHRARGELEAERDSYQQSISAGLSRSRQATGDEEPNHYSHESRRAGDERTGF